MIKGLSYTEYQKQYREKNKDILKQKAKEYQEARKEIKNKYMREYRKENLTKDRTEYMKEYRAKNKDKIKAIGKRYRENNKEKLSLYYKTYKPKGNTARKLKPEALKEISTKKKFSYMSDAEFQNYFDKPLRKYA